MTNPPGWVGHVTGVAYHAMTPETKRNPATHHEALRLADLDLASVASLIESQAPDAWLRDAAGWFLAALDLSSFARMGVYGLPNERGEMVPTLLVDVTRNERGPLVPARAAVVGVYYGEGKRLTLSVWPHLVGKAPRVSGAMLAS